MKILVALDGLNFEKALDFHVQLAPYCDGFKINHSLLNHTQMFENNKQELMIDLKLWDTPNSVCSIIETILEKSATMTTINTFNNSEVFRSIHQYSEDIKLLGVTYLTSWSPEEQFQITREMPDSMWRRNINRITKYGFAGIICGVNDIQDISNIDDNLLRVCPGITFRSSNSGQARTASPSDAVKAGADYIIIGRSITKSRNPVKTIETVKEIISSEK